MLILLLPLVWLAVAALVVTACRMAARADGAAQAERLDRASSG
jgi:hypothetical protein